MDTLVKCAGIAVVGAILCLMTRKQSGEFGVMASLGAGVLVITLGLSFFRPLMDFSRSLPGVQGPGHGIFNGNRGKHLRGRRGEVHRLGAEALRGRGGGVCIAAADGAAIIHAPNHAVGGGE